MRVLMVCLGNICRSPIAEGVLAHLAKQHGLNFTVASAGTESYHIGEAPDPSSQKACLAHGVDISMLRATKFIREDLTAYDRIYVMAEDVYNEVQRIGGTHADLTRVHYFLNELYNSPLAEKLNFKLTKNASVPDPYRHDQSVFNEVYDLIELGCKAIIENHKH